MKQVLRAQKLLDLVLGLLLLLSGLLLVRTALRLHTADAPEQRRYCLVIDAGHGGIDGGAVAFNGVKESEINLAIALRLRDLADLFGLPCEMIRTDDSRRTDILSYSEHEDLVYRAERANAVQNGILISIHQNFFPTSQPFGAQVLYAADEKSKHLGKLTHDAIVSNLQPENRRLAEQASPKLYLTSHVNCPAILVECGFLSNMSDLEKLSSEAYQTGFAAVLLQSYLTFIQSTSYT